MTRKSKCILSIIIVLALSAIIVPFITMTYVYHDRAMWNDMLDQQKEWFSTNSEISFQFKDYMDYSTNLYDVYEGKIKNNNVYVRFGRWEDSDGKTISFYDSNTDELLVKGDVSDYSESSFEIEITVDNIGLEYDEYEMSVR